MIKKSTVIVGCLSQYFKKTAVTKAFWSTQKAFLVPLISESKTETHLFIIYERISNFRKIQNTM